MTGESRRRHCEPSGLAFGEPKGKLREAISLPLAVVRTLGAFVPSGGFIVWWQSGHITWTKPISLALYAGSAAVVFPVFIWLRGTVPDATIPEVFD